MVVPKEFRVQPDSKPPEGFGGLADKLRTQLWDIMECYGSAADPHPICGVCKVHALSLDSIKSEVESGEMVGQLLISHREAMAARTKGALVGPTAR